MNYPLGITSIANYAFGRISYTTKVAPCTDKSAPCAVQYHRTLFIRNSIKRFLWYFLVFQEAVYRLIVNLLRAML